jgi:hypothetical protein
MYNIVACLLNARIVKPETGSLLGNGFITRNNKVIVGSGVFYAVRACISLAMDISPSTGILNFLLERKELISFIGFFKSFNLCNYYN